MIVLQDTIMRNSEEMRLESDSLGVPMPVKLPTTLLLPGLNWVMRGR